MKIYAGQLPYETTEDDLLTLFSEYGEVTDVRLIMDAASGRSKGFGFIEMPNQSEAIKALSALDGFEVSQRKIKVNEAENKPKNKKQNKHRY